MTGSSSMTVCGGKTRSGKECQRPAGWGTNHVGAGKCKLHSGASPSGEVAGQLELARREAAIMGRPLSVNPHDAILECIRIAAGEVQYATERIGELDADAAVAPATSRTVRPRRGDSGADLDERVDEAHVGGPELNIWIRVRHQAMDRLVNYSQTALKAGVEERQVQVVERQGQLLAGAVKRILVALGVADHPDAAVVVRRELSLVAGE